MMKLADGDPLHGITRLITRWTAAFVIDPDGMTRTTALGADRMARRLVDALPLGDRNLRRAVWTLVRPTLSPRLAALHAATFIAEHTPRRPSIWSRTPASRRSTTSTSTTARRRQPPRSDAGRFAL